MQYYLVERQGGGCDYTIGCGIRITKLKATSKDEAMLEASDDIGSSWKGNDEHSIDKAELLEVSESINLADFLDHKAAVRKSRKRIADEQAQREKDEADFERLKQRLGK
jgi:hypothetical protein